MASSTLAALSAGSAIAGADLFYSVQGGGDVKQTGTALQTFAWANQSLTGQQKVALVTVKATGNAASNARTVGTTSSWVQVNATASTEGVKLPAPSTGLAIQIFAPTAVGVLVYASSAGQSIGTGTTNTTGFAVTKNTGTTFMAVSTTKWRVTVA